MNCKADKPADPEPTNHSVRLKLMSGKTIVVIAFVSVSCAALVLFVWDRNLAAEMRERESNFIAIHFLASEILREGSSAGPRDFGGLLKLHGGPSSTLAKPFPNGLLYHSDKTSFILEEPEARRVSIFRSDRLVATERKWPLWEVAQRYARKFPEQPVPPEGFE